LRIENAKRAVEFDSLFNYSEVLSLA
jgi:hypothetical protein